MSGSTGRRRAAAAGVAGILFVAQLLQQSTAAGSTESTQGPKSGEGGLSPERVAAHLKEFERIADAHGGDRASGTAGHTASVARTEKLLRKAGYTTRRQPVPFRYTETLKEKLTLADGSTPPVVVAGYAPSTPAGGLGRRLAVPGGRSGPVPGCTGSEYRGAVVKGRIALVSSGGCGMDAKERAAAEAGADAVLVANEGPGELHTWLAEPDDARIPVGGVSGETGRRLAAEARADRPVRLVLRSLTEHRTTENLLATSPGGDPAHTVTAGAHLDSVPEGPGINDNAVAASVLLESALDLAREGHESRSRLVFGFWGAEEFGLRGSSHYVASLSAKERRNTALYLNLEMIGSPNPALFTLDPEAADPVSDRRPAPGSGEIADRLADAFTAQGTVSAPAPADGRSDYVPFVAAGIPTGGLYGGSFETKSPRQAAQWGGTAGAPFDPCYHLPCDRTDQYSRKAATLHGNAFHRVLEHYAQHPLATGRRGGDGGPG